MRSGSSEKGPSSHQSSILTFEQVSMHCERDLVFGRVGCRKHTIYQSSFISCVLETYYNCEMSRRWKNGSGVSRVQTQTDNIQAASGSAEFSYSVNRVSKRTSCHGDNWSPSWTAIAKHLDNTIHRVTKQHTFETLQLSAFYISVIKVKVHALKVTTAWVWLISSILI